MNIASRETLRAAWSRHAFALVVTALLAATLFAPALARQEVFSLRDHFDYFQPLRWFTAQELASGRLPLWNPYSASGEPWLANPQTGVFYPPAWLFLVLPFPAAYMLYLLLHLVLLGWGGYLLFARGRSQGAALVGAAALMFSGPVLSLLDVSNNFATLAWLPLVLWCAAERAWRRGAATLALAFLAAEPFFAALAAALFAIVFLVRRDGEEATPKRRIHGLLLSALFAFGLTAVQLLPFLEFVRGSDRLAAMGDALVLQDSMPLRDWPRVAVPPSLDATAIDRHLGQHFIPIIYMGVPVLLFALIGLTTLRRRRDTLGWLALLVLAIAVSAGPSLLTRLPLTIFRYPARLVPIAALAVAGLAAIGWQRIRPERRWLDLVIVLVIVADLLPRAMPLLATVPFRTDVVPYAKEIGTTAKVLRFGQIDPVHRGRWMSGYLNLYDRRFDAFTAAPLANAKYLDLYRNLLQTPTFARYAYAGIGYILTDYELPLPWYPVAGEGDVRVYRNRDAFPVAAHFTPGSAAVRHARWELDTSHARVTVNAPRDGVVVLRQQAAPGWRVTVDGAAAEPLLIDGIFRGVNVRRGHHEIVWTYRPATLFIGAAMTLVTLCTIFFSLFVKPRE